MPATAALEMNAMTFTGAWDFGARPVICPGQWAGYPTHLNRHGNHAEMKAWEEGSLIKMKSVGPWEDINKSSDMLAYILLGGSQNRINFNDS